MRKFIAGAAMTIGAAGIVGGIGYGGYELGERLNSATPQEVEAAQERYLQQQAGYIALAGSDCGRGVLSGLSVASENYYAAPKSAKKTEEALRQVCDDGPGVFHAELAKQAANEFKSVDTARSEFEKIKDQSEYDWVEKAVATMMPFFALHIVATGLSAAAKAKQARRIAKHQKQGGVITTAKLKATRH